MTQSPQLLLLDEEFAARNCGFFRRLLARHQDWMTAAMILREVGLPETDTNKRMIRALAEASSPEIICGQRGYRHIDFASPEELRHCVNWLESQASKMIGRAGAIRRRAHQKIG